MRTATVDSTGGTDVTAALQSFLNSSADGSVVCLAPGGLYRVDGMLSIESRVGLTVDGQGARIFAAVRSNTPKLRFVNGSDLAIRNLTLEAYHPEAGTSNAHQLSWEGGHGIAVYGTHGLTLGPNLTVRNVMGDGLYIRGASTPTGFRWADGITLRNCRIERNGRMGVAITDGARNIVVSNCVFDSIALYGFDIEPNGHVFDGVAAGAENVRFSDNTITSYGIDADLTPLLFTGTGLGPQRNIEFSRNVTNGVLRIGVWNVGGTGRSDFRIVDNLGAQRVAGPTMAFDGVAGVTVTGNAQPLSSGSLTSALGCTAVTIANNTTQ